MIERWFSASKLPLTFEQFKRLPQNRAYKYEYSDEHAWLTPRPQSYHAMLNLGSFVRPIAGMGTQEELHIRLLAEEDWYQLPPLFAAAFHRVQPFASLADEARLLAAEECLRETKEGANGPLVPQASLVAVRKSEGALVGAFLTTLSPGGDAESTHALRWNMPPPLDAVARRMGRPHLTWVFVGPWHARFGVGTALLDAAVRALIQLGYWQLASTFLLGNDFSALWHWRMGFRLLAHPGSMRSMQN